MADNSNIEWTDATWNWLAGCDAVSPGCKHCYAVRLALRLEAMGQAHYTGVAARNSKGKPYWTGQVNVAPDDVFLKPLRWKKPRTIFVNSMSDTFHEDVPDGAIMRAWWTMAHCPQHTFQILTKRPQRMFEFFTKWADTAGDGDFKMARGPEAVREQHTSGRAHLFAAMLDQMGDPPPGCAYPLYDWAEGMRWWSAVLPNVVLMTSVEDQRRADERIPWLLRTPAACRGISAEPLLGPLDLTKVGLQRLADGRETWIDALAGARFACDEHAEADVECNRLDWVIAGGESQSGARPMSPAWVRKLRDDCEAAGVAFHFKQWGEYGPVAWEDRPTMTTIGGEEWFGMARVGKHKAGRILDGRTHDALPVLNGRTG